MFREVLPEPVVAATVDVHRESIGSMLGYSSWNGSVESFDSSCLMFSQFYDVNIARSVVFVAVKISVPLERAWIAEFMILSDEFDKPWVR